MASSLLDYALSYAARGWYVFPCREKPGAPFIRNGETIIPEEKTPYTTNGFKDATVDADQIKAWWEKWPNALIGISTGPSGLFVVDIDKKHVNGFDTYSTWGINDSQALRAWTPSGGMHVIFSGTGRTSTNASTGIDTRGEGGYFIAPPSKVIEGKFPGEYRFENDWSKDPGIIPDGLMSRLFPNKTREYVKGTFTPAQQGEKKKLSKSTLYFLSQGAKEGERNSTLFKALADMAGCGYTKDEAREKVLDICKKIGLSRGEVETVLDHAYSKERVPAIPDELQAKIAKGGKELATSITFEEQTLIEYAVLASMITDNLIIPVVSDVLNSEDFQLIQNKIIYKHIVQMYNAGMKVDILTLSNDIAKDTRNIKLDDISRMLALYFVNPDNIITYIDIIKEKASIRRLEAILDNKRKYLSEKNLAHMLNALEKDISNVALYGGIKSSSVLDAKQATEMVKMFTEQIVSGKIEQLRTGFVDYDNYIGGIYNNELIIIAGLSGTGKSAMSLSIVNNVSITQGKSSAIFSLEMSTHETICRLICQLTGIPFRKVYNGKMNEQEWKLYGEAMDKIASSKIYFDDGVGMTIPEIRAKIRKLVDKDNLDLVVIDQLEQVKGYDMLSPNIRYNNLTYEIKDISKEFQVPIILNHQLNRAIADRHLRNPEPEATDLNQAGEKAVNQVWIIVHKKDVEQRILQSKVRVVKNRNGPTMEFPVIFLGERMLFASPVKEEDKIIFHNGEEEQSYYTSNIPGWAN
ncbi:MAG TPA: DnaB-like helicase C-terminal domain-containing protein [bacterium]|nr:DnaB-like helicase C-terminal domain-containing protein [bacterium]